jgi:hypothetical protein
MRQQSASTYVVFKGYSPSGRSIFADFHRLLGGISFHGWRRPYIFARTASKRARTFALLFLP